MKVFISQGMRGLTDEQILKRRTEIIDEIKERYKVNTVEIIDSFLDLPEDTHPLKYLAKSIELLADADVVYFDEGFEAFRGCNIEYICAKEYGKEVAFSMR